MMATNIFDLTGKAAVVTGGGRGLGRGMALALARAGASIAVADLDGSTARAVSQEILALGRRSIGIEVDVSHKSHVQRMIGAALEEFGKLDISVNSAGVPGSRLPSSELIEESDARRFIDVMLLGTFFCCQEAAKPMMKQSSGRIINIGSISSVIVNKGLVGLAPYCAVKAGVVHMSQALAADWAPYNITVNCISPGYMLTPATEAIMPQREKMYAEQALLNRIGMPADLDGAVVFLASEASSFVTGHNLLVDGGATVW
jgi:NAD(P)-dependent dehydrogenase (short-subunit alcohol dehydrogenase family)